jgi:hypothetical protein
MLSCNKACIFLVLLRGIQLTYLQRTHAQSTAFHFFNYSTIFLIHQSFEITKKVRTSYAVMRSGMPNMIYTIFF